MLFNPIARINPIEQNHTPSPNTANVTKACN
jgi:hypothetical protein